MAFCSINHPASSSYWGTPIYGHQNLQLRALTKTGRKKRTCLTTNAHVYCILYIVYIHINYISNYIIMDVYIYILVYTRIYIYIHLHNDVITDIVYMYTYIYTQIHS